LDDHWIDGNYSQFLETHRGQNSRVKPGIPVPVDNFTRPDPTRPAGNGSGRVYPRVRVYPQASNVDDVVLFQPAIFLDPGQIAFMQLHIKDMINNFRRKKSNKRRVSYSRPARRGSKPVYGTVPVRLFCAMNMRRPRGRRIGLGLVVGLPLRIGLGLGLGLGLVTYTE